MCRAAYVFPVRVLPGGRVFDFQPGRMFTLVVAAGLFLGSCCCFQGLSLGAVCIVWRVCGAFFSLCCGRRASVGASPKETTAKRKEEPLEKRKFEHGCSNSVSRVGEDSSGKHRHPDLRPSVTHEATAHTGNRALVTSMEGLYDATTLCVLNMALIIPLPFFWRRTGGRKSGANQRRQPTPALLSATVGLYGRLPS